VFGEGAVTWKGNPSMAILVMREIVTLQMSITLRGPDSRVHEIENYPDFTCNCAVEKLRRG